MGKSKMCEWFGHKWQPIYIVKENQFKFIATACGRWNCRFGDAEILDFVIKNQPITNTYSKKYFN